MYVGRISTKIMSAKNPPLRGDLGAISDAHCSIFYIRRIYDSGLRELLANILTI